MALMTTKCNKLRSIENATYLLQAQFYTQVLVITSIYHPNYISLLKMQISNLDGTCQDTCSYYLNYTPICTSVISLEYLGVRFQDFLYFKA